MRFTYECDGMDGLIMVDKQYLEEIDETLLYELDNSGKLNLIQ